MKTNNPGTYNQYKYGQGPEGYKNQSASYQSSYKNGSKANQPSNYDFNPSAQSAQKSNLSRLDPSFKQKNKGMYSSNITFGSTGSNPNMSLFSFGRQVNQGTIEKDYNDKNQYSNNKNNDFLNLQIPKNQSIGQKNQKMASSAIFPMNNAQQSQIDRFPTINVRSGLQAPSSSSSSNNNSNTQGKTNQSAKQRRDKQLMEIKKQLDELNKKMMKIPESNQQSTSNPQQNLQVKPSKPAGVSQSAIFQTSSTSTSNNFSNKFNQYKNPPTAPLSSLEQLYTQKKSPQSIPSYEQPPKKQNPAYDITQPQAQKKDNYNFNQMSNALTSQSSKYSSYGTNPSNSYQKQSYKSYGSTNPNSGVSSYSGYTGTSDMTGYGYSGNSATKDNSYMQFPAKQGQTSGFKKKKAPTIQQPPASQQKQNYKQNIYQPQPVSTQPNKPINSYQTSYGSNIRKIQSYDIVDNSVPPQKFDKIKYSDFHIGKKMGKGMFGEVLLVKHKVTGWLCGLKVMDKKIIKEEKYAGQIARELSIQFYLSHRNILQLYGYFEDQKNFYLLIQFCTGGQLLQRIKQQRRMNERDVALIIKQVCQGLEYIHLQLIIHRDIKPQNILFNMGVVKICDFGWSVYREYGMRKTASGSPLYYPPQIVKGQEYDDKIDNWCIGMMAYECIIGKIPFRVYTENDLCKIVSDQVTFPEWVDVSNQAKDFILKTLKKNPQNRMTIKQMLRHPFITKHSQNQLPKQVLEQIKKVLQ